MKKILFYIVIIVVLAGFVVGILKYASRPVEVTPNQETKNTNLPTNANTNLFTAPDNTFSFEYPKDLVLSNTSDRSWSDVSTTSGIRIVEITIPKSFEPNTNFSEATFSVGTSSDSNCLSVENGNPETTKEVTINGTTFSKFDLTDAGAGNLYETTTYRAEKNNVCYAIEYTIHSTNIGNYSPDQGITEFDKSKVTEVLENIVRSFKFL